MKNDVILITGGHPTPAIACIDHIFENSPQTKIVFVGRRYINNREKNETLEYKEVSTKVNVKFYHSTAQRGMTGIMNLHKSLMQVKAIFDMERPNKILSFGGYISIPVCLMAIFYKIPYYIHEQTSVPGNANRIMGMFARKVFVSFDSTTSDFFTLPHLTQTGQGVNVMFTGNPIRKEILTPQNRPEMLSDISGPLLFVNGGNMGSHAINDHMFQIIPQLLLNVNILHQIGNVEEYGDWDKAQKCKEDTIGSSIYKYIPVKHLSTLEMAGVFQNADFVVCRAGANTFFELIALKKPAILVPLPYSARDEQQSQAQILADQGVAEIFDQNQSSSELYERIMAVYRSLSTHLRSYSKLEKFININATKTIWENISK